MAVVSGVHSPRAKRLAVTRWAERRGITTLAPLLQVALPGSHDVEARVRLGEAREAAALANTGDDAEITRRLQDEAASMLAGGARG
ncbi:hypothetical protein [Sorangium sp. So ce1097]|uniref:hypothetical protein n=1 Tax=Sorangium sp. So ce1097 TaxID=3133330 RepID=UPI003F5F330A